MGTSKRTLNQERILRSMDKVYENLISFKRRMNSELVILKIMRLFESNLKSIISLATVKDAQVVN
jgi:hypothetical protein